MSGGVGLVSGGVGRANAAAPAGESRPGRSDSESLRQLSEASASFHVVDGRMIFAALAGSGW